MTTVESTRWEIRWFERYQDGTEQAGNVDAYDDEAAAQRDWPVLSAEADDCWRAELVEVTTTARVHRSTGYGTTVGEAK